MKGVLVFLMLINCNVCFSQNKFRKKEELLTMVLDSVNKNFDSFKTRSAFKIDCVLLGTEFKELIDYNSIKKYSFQIKFGDFERVKRKHYFFYINFYEFDIHNGFGVAVRFIHKETKNGYGYSDTIFYQIIYDEKSKMFILMPGKYYGI